MNRPNIEDLKPSRRPDSRTEVRAGTAFTQCQLICFRYATSNPESAEACREVADLIAELARAWGAD